MVRKDEIDLGVWTGEPGAARRSARHSRHQARPMPSSDAVCLTRLENGGGHHRRMRALDPADPVRYDFSLCHVGMMNACGYGRRQRTRTAR